MMDVPAAAAAIVAPRRLPVGAELLPGGEGVHFRVWAPQRRRVDVVVEGGAGVALAREAGGYFAGVATGVGTGARYRYRLDGAAQCADPASRFQPDGPHGASLVVDPAAHAWRDAGWRGLALEGQVIYELHVGTFTREGTWAAALLELPALAELGITAIELMPVADFPGRWGWGYDGVAWFAPTRLYGSPDDMRRFVDGAHALGIGVLLDVVYNHYGPAGCTLREFASAWVSTRHKSEWGDSPNFDGDASAPVREFVLANAAYWIDEFHLDGLRLDATQSIVDDSHPHIALQIGERVRAAARGRATLVVAENEPQHARLVRAPERGGWGLDMIWNDDWHHAALVAATAQDEAYCTDYRGRPQEFVSAAKHGFLYQGQWYRWQAQRRGAPAFDVEPARFVHFLENHDQVANAHHAGERVHRLASAARWRALTALLLLGPQTPMLFQGQEFAATAPFVFFADHEPALARDVQRGRLDFTAQFAQLAQPAMARRLPTPHDAASFERCRVDHAERTLPGHREAWAMHRDLLALRRGDAALRRAQRLRAATDGAVLGDEAFVLRCFGERDGDDRLLVVNLGRTLHLDPAPEPLLAPPEGAARWRLAWSSQDARYGGIGTLEPDAAEADRRIPGRDLPRPFDNWRLQGESAMLLAPAYDAAGGATA